MTTEGWELHQWAAELKPGTIMWSRNGGAWQYLVEQIKATGADVDRLGAWVRIIDDGPRIAVYLNPALYTQDMVEDAIARINPRIARCLAEGPGVDDAWQVSIGTDGRMLYDMQLQAVTEDQAELLEALETVELVWRKELVAPDDLG